jgi:hypothetical protein
MSLRNLNDIDLPANSLIEDTVDSGNVSSQEKL